MRSGVRKAFDDIYLKTETKYRAVQSSRSAKRIVKEMGGVSPEYYDCYKQEVLPFWSKYRQKPSAYWYRLFAPTEKEIDPRFIPEDMWYGTILPYFSNMMFRRPYEDKCMHTVLFPNIKRPRTVVKCMGGQYYTDDLSPLTEEEATEKCRMESAFIMKPSIDSGTGRLIQFYDSNVDKKESIPVKMKELGKNYIVQEIVEQHPVLASLHKSSLNTIRILSFYFRGEVFILSAIIRMGAGNQRVDNVSSGGLQCGIHMDGQLYEKACTLKRDWITQHPDGAIFSKIKVPSFDKIVEIVKAEHVKLPHFRLIGWDFSVDTANEPVFIEYNVCPGANQMTCGPTFGNLTEMVLEDVFINRSLDGNQN